MKIKTFKDLTVWQEAHQLVLMAYKITEAFPTKEQFGLSAQMRRAAISVTSNIAEGFGRKTANDKEHFYVMAYGSLTELENQLEIAHDLHYINKETYNLAYHRINEVGQLLNGLLRAHRTIN